LDDLRGKEARGDWLERVIDEYWERRYGRFNDESIGTTRG
jgi:hypothetical protein